MVKISAECVYLKVSCSSEAIDIIKAKQIIKKVLGLELKIILEELPLNS